MSFAQIKAITFDAAHTLFHPFPSVGAIYREVMAEHGLDYPEADLERGFRRAFKSVTKDAAILDGEARERSYWRHIVATSIADLSPQPNDYDALFAALWDTFAHGDRWRVDPEAAAILEQLRSDGFAIGLLTNWDHRVRQVVAECPLADAFDALFISSEIGHEKPDPGIFRYAETALGFRSEQCLHVGDSLQHDIQGAQNAGWSAIRLTSDSTADGLDNVSITNLAELPALLGLG